MAENKKKEAIGRLKVRLEQAVATVDSDTALQGVPVAVESGRAGMSSVVGGLAGVWDSPRAEEVAAGIGTDVATIRARVGEAYEAAVMADAAEDETEVPGDDDRARPKWDR